MEGDSPSSVSGKTSETPSPTKPATKSRYSSCLSSFRNNYKPPVNSKTSNSSSPVVVIERKHSESVPSLLAASIPPPCSPVNPSLNKDSFSSVLSPQDKSFIDIPAPSPFKDEVEQGSPNLGSYVPLTGKGGNWRGPNQSDMTPENKSRQQYRQGSGFRNSRGGRDSYLGGLNSSTPNHSFGRNDCDGNNSFNSSQGGFSPYNTPGNNSSNNRGNKRGSHQNTPSVDISSYYSPAMTQDPWADLVKRKKCRDNTTFPQNSSTNFQ